LRSGNLDHSYSSSSYYYYANDTRGRSWSARREQQGGWFCISDEKHALPSRNYRDDNSNLHREENGLKAKQFKILDDFLAGYLPVRANHENRTIPPRFLPPPSMVRETWTWGVLAIMAPPTSARQLSCADSKWPTANAGGWPRRSKSA
jgi:hypothetical protein